MLSFIVRTQGNIYSIYFPQLLNGVLFQAASSTLEKLFTIQSVYVLWTENTRGRHRISLGVVELRESSPVSQKNVGM